MPSANGMILSTAPGLIVGGNQQYQQANSVQYSFNQNAQYSSNQNASAISFAQP